MDHREKEYIINRYCQEVTWNDKLSVNEIFDLIRNHKYFNEILPKIQITDDFIKNRIVIWRGFHEKDINELKNDSNFLNFISLKISIFSLILNKNDISKEEIVKEIDFQILKELSNDTEFSLDEVIDYIRKVICE